MSHPGQKTQPGDEQVFSPLTKRRELCHEKMSELNAAKRQALLLARLDAALEKIVTLKAACKDVSQVVGDKDRELAALRRELMLAKAENAQLRESLTTWKSQLEKVLNQA